MDADRYAEAGRFLRVLGERHTFQTFDDSPRKDRSLSRILHGTLAEHADTLAGLNARGAGVFVMVNAGDGRGRRADNVRQVRAYFIDLDGAPLEPVQTAPLPPHAIIESSPGRWHAYWRIDGAPLDAFRAAQTALLAARFNADRKVCDLPRVMRLPGFEHRKGEPFRTRIVALRDDLPAYRHADFFAAFGIDLSASPISKVEGNRKGATVTALPTAKRTRRTLPDTIPEGTRNSTLLSLAAGLVSKGFDLQAVTERLQRINTERCQPPLCASEVDTIATRAVAYGSDGFTILPHKLLDAQLWKALAPPVHDIILLAFRRYDRNNNRNIALTFADFEGRPGFGTKETFYTYRDAAIASGILVLASEGGMTQTGRKPDLFAIAPEWLHDTFARSEIPTMRKVGKSDPYIDKQIEEKRGSRAHAGANRKPKKDRAA